MSKRKRDKYCLMSFRGRTFSLNLQAIEQASEVSETNSFRKITPVLASFSEQFVYVIIATETEI